MMPIQPISGCKAVLPDTNLAKPNGPFLANWATRAVGPIDNLERLIDRLTG